MAVVEFLDPLENKNIHYHIDEKLQKKWDKLSKKVVKDNSDRVYVVVGKERVGKSTWTFQQAKYIDPTFNVDRICFTPMQFLQTLRNTDKGKVVVFDEAFRGFSSKSSQSKVNKLLVQAMMEVGMRNLIIFIVLPSFSLLEPYVANHRSNALFYITRPKETNSKRIWRAYNTKKKARIYWESKKKYGRMPYVTTNLKGLFWSQKSEQNGVTRRAPYQTFDVEAYEQKKIKAFDGNEKENFDKSKNDYNKLRFKLSRLKFPIETQKAFAEVLEVPYDTLRGWRNLDFTE